MFGFIDKTYRIIDYLCNMKFFWFISLYPQWNDVWCMKLMSLNNRSCHAGPTIVDINSNETLF